MEDQAGLTYQVSLYKAVALHYSKNLIKDRFHFLSSIGSDFCELLPEVQTSRHVIRDP